MKGRRSDKETNRKRKCDKVIGGRKGGRCARVTRRGRSGRKKEKEVTKKERQKNGTRKRERGKQKHGAGSKRKPAGRCS